MTHERSTILAVDDDPINIEVMKEILEEHYGLLTAETGEEALELATQYEPDLILLDIMMPGIDGYETCRRLREDPRCASAKILLVSAKAMVSERLRGYEIGADDYITKPFDKDELLAKVRVFLRLKSAEELHRLKGQLLSLVAHEIRTPMTGILPAAELLMGDESLGVSDRQMLAEMILENGARLLALAERGMMLCQIREGVLALSPAEIDLSEVVRSVVQGVARMASNRVVQLDVDAGEPVRIVGDASRLEVALSAVVEHAIRAASNGSEIRVRLTEAAGKATFTVTTVGMTFDEQDGSLFDAFGPRTVDGQIVGSGLNLAVARALLRAHHGDLAARATDEGEPAFTGWLPVKVPVKVGR